MKVKISKALLAELFRQPGRQRRFGLVNSHTSRRTKRSRVICSALLIFTIWALYAFLGIVPTDARAQTSQVKATDIRISTAWSADRVRPGDRIIAAVVIEMAAGLHINADAKQLKPISGFRPFATELKVASGSEGFVSELPYYPRAHPVKFDFADEALMVFDGRVVIYLPIQIDEQFTAPELKLNLQLAYQACGKDFCLFPEKLTRTLTRPVAEPGASVSTINQEIFADFKTIRAIPAEKDVVFDLFGWRFSVGAESRTGWLLRIADDSDQDHQSGSCR